MRLVILSGLLVLGSCCVNAQQFQLQHTRTASPLGKVAFGIDVAPNGLEYAIAGRGDTMVVLNAATNEPEHRVKLEPLTLAVEYSPDGGTLAALSDPGVLQLFRTDSWEILHRIDLAFRCGFLSFHPTEPLIAVGGSGSTVEIYDYKTGKKQRSIGKSDRTQGVKFSPDGESVFVNAWHLKPTNRSELIRYSLATEAATSYGSQHGILRRIVVSGDQKYLATVSPDGFVMVLSLDSQQKHQWEVEDKLSQFAVFLSDNRTLLVGGEKGWYQFDVNRNDRFDIDPASEVVNAYDGCFVPGTNDLLVAHTRQPNQLTRWTVIAQDSPPAQAKSGFASISPTAERNSEKADSVKSDTALPMSSTVPNENRQDASSDTGVVTTQNGTSPLFEAAQMREWTSASGTTTEAAWIGSDSKDVLLRKESGEETIVPRRVLSELDQNLLNQIDRMRRPEFPQEAPTSDEREYQVIDYAKSEIVEYRENVKRGSSDGNVRHIDDVELDSFGRIWVSCRAGLFTFREDGRFYYEAAAPIPDSSADVTEKARIGAIAMDRFDRVVAIANERLMLGQVVRYDGFRWTRLDMPKGLLAEDLIRFGDDVVASGDFNGLAILGDTGWRVVEQTAYAGRIRTGQLTQLPDGKLLVRVYRRHPLIFDGKEFTTLEVPGFQPGIVGDSLAICADHEGSFYVQDDRLSAWSVYRFSPSTHSRTLVYDSDGTREAACTSIGCAADGAIWITTAKGVFRRRGDSWQLIHKSDSWLPLIPLQDGRVWTAAGLMFDPIDRPTRNVDDPQALYANFPPRFLPQQREDGATAESKNPMRIWSDRTGKYETRASLVKFDSRLVTLRRVDGHVVTLPLTGLSQQDQDYLRNIQSKVHDEIPPNSAIDPSTFKFITFYQSGFRKSSDGTSVFHLESRGVAVENERYPDLDDDAVRLRMVNGVVSDQAGRVWIAGNAGLYEYVDGEFYYRHRGPVEDLDQPARSTVSTLEASRLSLGPDGKPIMYFERSKSFYRLEGSELERLGNPTIDGKSSQVRHLFAHKDDLYGVGDFPGIVKYTRGNWRVVSGTASQQFPQLEHPAPLADGSMAFNAVDREDRKLRLWKWHDGRLQNVLQGTKPGEVRGILARGDSLFVQVMDGIDRFLLRVEGTEQTVWNQPTYDLAVAADGSLWMVNSGKLGRHDGQAWEIFEHEVVEYGNLFALANGDVWLAGRGILIIDGN